MLPEWYDLIKIWLSQKSWITNKSQILPSHFLYEFDAVQTYP